MILHPCLLHFIVFLLPLSFSSGLIAKPGCPERCGDLLVSYPFGIGSNCSRGGSFGLICNTSTHPPRLHFTTGIQIIEINTSYVRVNYPFLVAGACYNGASLNDTPDIWRQINLTKTQFTLSEENRLTAIGCDDIAVGIGESNHNYSDGCVAYCSKPDNLSGSGFCPDDASLNSDAYGCCRTPIPGGTSLLKAQMSDLSGKWLRSKLFSCSYAFVEERSINESGFSYPFSILNDPTAFQGSNWPATIAPPVVRLDWTIWPLIKHSWIPPLMHVRVTLIVSILVPTIEDTSVNANLDSMAILTSPLDALILMNVVHVVKIRFAPTIKVPSPAHALWGIMATEEKTGRVALSFHRPRLASVSGLV